MTSSVVKEGVCVEEKIRTGAVGLLVVHAWQVCNHADDEQQRSLHRRMHDQGGVEEDGQEYEQGLCKPVSCCIIKESQSVPQ